MRRFYYRFLFYLHLGNYNDEAPSSDSWDSKFFLNYLLCWPSICCLMMIWDQRLGPLLSVVHFKRKSYCLYEDPSCVSLTFSSFHSQLVRSSSFFLLLASWVLVTTFREYDDEISGILGKSLYLRYLSLIVSSSSQPLWLFRNWTTNDHRKC